MEISFVDENDFVKKRKWYFLSENSQWDTSLVYMHCTKFHPLKNVSRSRSFRKEFWFLIVLWLRWSRFVRRTEAQAWKEPRVSKFFVYSRVLLRFSYPISLLLL